MRLVPPLLALCYAASGDVCALAQQIRGRVVEAESGHAVAGVEVILLDGRRPRALARVLTDTSGRFTLHLSTGGTYRLRTRRLGYQDNHTTSFQVGPEEAVDVELPASVEPLPIEPIRITARSVHPNAYLESQGFYARRITGLGAFITSTEIGRVALLSDALRRIPGVRLVRADRSGRRYDVVVTRAASISRCLPAIFLDGIPARPGGQPRATDVPIDDMVGAADIEGMEIYSGPSLAPPNFSRGGECGVIVIWTKRRTE